MRTSFNNVGQTIAFRRLPSAAASRQTTKNDGLPHKQSVRGTALLAVLWLSAALGAIAFSLADTVRGEAERSATAVDGLRAQDLAIGGLRRAILYMDWGRTHPDIPRFKPPQPFFILDFPEGQTIVDVVPETAKFNINRALPDELFRLVLNLGVGPARAQEIAAAIVDWREPPPPPSGSAFDEFYASLRPPYVAPHARFQEIEELLSVKGVTPDLYYGDWQAMGEGPARQIAPRTGLRDCLSVYGTVSQFDVNTAPPAVLAAAGVPPEGVAALVQHRRGQPFATQADLAPFTQIAGDGFSRLRVGGITVFTLRSTARLRLANGQLSDLRRSVGAQVKFLQPGQDITSYHILRWYDWAL
ncbi:MAG: general secretion pathway protein GspK [Bryobacteraceae bacterium]